ncbi:hypothetical protein FALBO_14511 [Fusarium albosuccineum]|uniref:Uncharacterized protein n=1 Tax=Fusarium albosuccineum TaxID=1237068 RepID=A0A8H4P4E1_9HYPO|nr:hypothetical protein FALBO_14511 [Fusarium albosuccineum]
MGQRHQLFVIARVGKYYRPLAAIHHQWLYGVSALRSCRRIIRIFSDPSNQAVLQHELRLAADYFRDKGPPPDEPFEFEYEEADKTPCPFPFITTCLSVGAAYDFELGRIQTTHELAFGTGFDQGDNNDGITVIDITDTAHVRYCFMTLYDDDDTDGCTPLTGQQYVRRYYPDSHSMVVNNRSTIEELDETPLVQVEALAETWPWGEWKIDDMTEQAEKELDSQSEARNPTKSLRDLAATKLFSRLLQSTDDDFDPSVLREVQDLPTFPKMLREYLQDHPEQVGCSAEASGHLLLLAYAGDAFLDWTLFPNLTIKAIKYALASDALKTITGLALTVPRSCAPNELSDAISSVDHIETLQILDRPDRKDEEASNQIFEALVESNKQKAIKKLTLTGLYANGLRLNVWRPYQPSPKTLAGCPVVQLLMAHEGNDAGFMRSSNLEYFHLGDAALSPVKFVVGLFQYLASRVSGSLSYNGTGLDVAHCFSCGSSALGDDASLEMSPLPAEVHRIGKESYHSSSSDGLYSKMRDLTPGAWTVVVSEYRDKDIDMRSCRKTQLHFKYAFVRSKATIQVDPENWRGSDISPSEIEAVDLQGFLSQAAPGVDTSKLAHQFNKLDEAVALATNESNIYIIPEDTRLLSLLSPEEACRLLNQFVETVPEVQRVAKRVKRQAWDEFKWLSNLGFNLEPEPPKATSG